MGEWRSGGVFSTAPDARKAGGFDVRLDGVCLLEVARGDDELDLRLAALRLCDIGINAEKRLVLARPSRAAEKYAPWAYPLPKLAFLRLVAVRDVELEAACHLDDSFRSASGDKASRVEIGLREDAGERREDVAEEPAGCLVARRAAVADACVYEEDGYAIASRRPDEVWPYLAFGEDYRTRTDGLQRTLYEVREIERIVYKDIALGDFLLRHLPAGGTRRGKDKLYTWLDLSPFAHQLARDLDLTYGNGMDPDEPAFPELC